MDPGIMKRNENCFGCHEIEMKIVHKGAYKTTKLCLTCGIARPFRSSHCSDCDNCTLRFDHHCPWIGGCVGKRNYIYFFIFLALLNINNFYLLIFAVIHIFLTYLNTTEEEKKINSWVAKKLLILIPSLFTIILIGATMLFTTGLFIYHFSLILFNRTTKEEIKHYRKLKIPNPYDRGMTQNCNEFWTRHKSMEYNYTVKDLRKKEKIEKKFSKFSAMSSKKLKPKILPYSEKEKNLKNKEKKNSNDLKNKSDDKEMEFNSNSKYSKSSITENKSITYSENSSSKNQLQNNNQIINEIKNKIKKKNSQKKKKSDSTSEKKSPKNSIKSSKSCSQLKSSSSDNENNKEGLFDNFSDEDISDENDFSNRKICNTSIKNSNLNNQILNKMNNVFDKNINHKYRLKTYGNTKNINLTNNDDSSYKIAQKRLEELSSEVTVHEEINQLKSSLSIPMENSCSFSLSQS